MAEMHILLSHIAQTFGLILFVLAFALVLLYALSPSNALKFDRASRVPLDEEASSDD
ncbi:cbb3-type cytochrome c oxidase subunit 3 [Parvularcula sp. LCG005]|uniref:cbb3-type cytochrome c oxidase subunit 3 n=1 Tax=Parvularcula sp. LCG005 TaxID=3078805 RepID=UPI002943CD67|nr:cbb3-type cytochrome c oxidase subunit 3 [Parvularcula sp. LCG005]WOI54172.1 cbb3-type cytochrome c oxidase subunit 3 [Parvularcula sp. LCG005]